MVPTGLRLIPLFDGMQPPVWPQKDPTEFITYGVDFARIIGPDVSLDRLLTLVVDGAATIGANDVQGTIATVEIGGGVDGYVAEVVIKVLSGAGDVIVRTILLPIVAQTGASLLPSFGNPLSPTGFRLTDPITGQTITDPITGLPLTLPAIPGSTVAVLDPVTGLPMIDPVSNLPLTVPVT